MAIIVHILYHKRVFFSTVSIVFLYPPLISRILD